MKLSVQKLRLLMGGLLALLLAAGIFTVGYFSGRGAAGAAAPGQSCTVRYLVDGKVYEKEKVIPGSPLQGVGYPETEESAVLLWLDGNGRPAEPAGFIAYSDLSFEAVTGPRLRGESGYFPCENGLFRPESPLSRGEAAEILWTLLGSPEAEKAELRDVGRKDPCYAAACALTEAGLMEAPGGMFEPEKSFSEEDFAALLGRFFRPEAVESAVGRIRGLGSGTVTRAEAAVALNELLGLSGKGSGSYPDVPADYWAGEALALAGSGDWNAEKARPGFVNIDGYLYHIEEDGYFLKNAYVGSLYFDADGRYTSGDRALDAAVAKAIRENTDGDMEREEMLRALYLYVRDGFSYLRRNYYELGDGGWGLQEARTMYESGKGNCYSYASAFWAAARGLGYDAMVVSGTIGSEKSPHGWVEIPMDDGRYVFDVEIEMSYIRDGKVEPDMFKMEHVSARYAWLYVELNDANHTLPRSPLPGMELR